jgi:G3E family GTPase
VRVAIPVHIVAGPLGAGKTTALLHVLAARAGVERLGVLVNDVGLAGLDRERLQAASSAPVIDVPGGCVCCTAPEGFEDGVQALLAQGIDRLLIEPTGLADPGDLVDRLRGSRAAEVLDLQPVVVIVDPTTLPEPEQLGPPMLTRQADAADILVFSRAELATVADRARARRWLAARWPAPLRALWIAEGALDLDQLGWPPGHERRGSASRGEHEHEHEHEHEREHDTVHGHRAASRQWGTDVRFDQDRLGRALARIVGGEAGAPLARLKGVFQLPEGTVRLEIAGGRMDEGLSGFRRGSAVDAIFGPGDPSAPELAIAWLDAAGGADG